MTTALREAPHHRNLTCYTDYRCRLPECVTRYNARNRERLRAKKNGTWHAYVDARPVREHLLQLQAENVTPCIVAHVTRLPKQSILDFLVPNPNRGRGRRQRTSPEIAAKILAVTADCLGGKVPATGPGRRIRALVAAGWPLNHISARSALHQETVGRAMRCDTVYATTAAAIARTYDELRTLRPTRHGVSAVQAKRASDWAVRGNWPTIRYWADRMDVIDDPHFHPEYGTTKRLVIAQDAHWVMTTTGLSRAETAARLGVDKSYIEHAFRDHPEYAVEVAA
ncbi:hypothetical protein IHE56_01070 [Streptomyces sp. ID01-12c]|nr:hypothetical protein [Streptomyces caniscabiei]